MTATVVTMNNDLHEQMHAIGSKARIAYSLMAEARNEQKDMALVKAAMALRDHKADILAANKKDIEYAKGKQLDAAQIDRLTLDDKRIEAMATGLETVATLPDPVNKVMDEWERPNGLLLQRVSIPLGGDWDYL
jgi:glutamate-5-semialdehyde dehydrogenase